MKVILNGVATEVSKGERLVDFVERLSRDRRGRGVAVAVNGEVVSRSEWARRELDELDRIEILDAVGGG